MAKKHRLSLFIPGSNPNKPIRPYSYYVNDPLANFAGGTGASVRGRPPGNSVPGTADFWIDMREPDFSLLQRALLEGKRFDSMELKIETLNDQSHPVNIAAIKFKTVSLTGINPKPEEMRDLSAPDRLAPPAYCNRVSISWDSITVAKGA